MLERIPESMYGAKSEATFVEIPVVPGENYEGNSEEKLMVNFL